MKTSVKLPDNLRDHLVVMGWIAVAVFAKYWTTPDSPPEPSTVRVAPMVAVSSAARLTSAE
ncbi:hypothetical protein ETAA8_34410 [Anatilimnocola aggregata]|uniref:Uncharacterized protein n=1 Tax=Anatilimnocola aggregata TaxID=2528021 RepID=A0A517YDN3_9BACT|nr:hypothetical protein [Anatilimnocola aggregata]QDU28341.1 hypothetical protein ETAA8_34410 [Anatilimnocola aggregata]